MGGSHFYFRTGSAILSALYLMLLINGAVSTDGVLVFITTIATVLALGILFFGTMGIVTDHMRGDL